MELYQYLLMNNYTLFFTVYIIGLITLMYFRTKFTLNLFSIFYLSFTGLITYYYNLNYYVFFFQIIIITAFLIYIR